jgi:hypothetical protein
MDDDLVKEALFFVVMFAVIAILVGLTVYVVAYTC